MYRHHTKGYNKVYHSRNKQIGGGVGGKQREKGGRKQTKNPLIQHPTNVLDHETLFSNNTTNTYRILAFLRTEFG